MKPKPTVGIVGKDSGECSSLNLILESSGLVAIRAKCLHENIAARDTHCSQFMDSSPNVVLLDASDLKPALASLSFLKSRLPNSWLMMVSEHPTQEAVIEAMRAGAREFLSKPLSPDALQEALDRFLDERGSLVSEKKPAQFYAVTTAKEGSGATSVSINLAAALAKIEPAERVALLDLVHPVGDVAPYLDLKHPFGLSEALESAPRIDSVLLESYMVKKEQFMVLPGFKEFDPSRSLSVEALRRVMTVAGETFDQVVIDIPSFHHPEEFHMVGGLSSTILVVVTPELPSLWRTHQLLEFLNRDGIRGNLRVVLNRCPKRFEITHRQIEKTLRLPVFWELPNDYADSIEAINSGRPLVSMKRVRLGNNFLGLAQRLSGQKQRAKRSSFFTVFAR